MTIDNIGNALAILAQIYAEVACIEGMKAENQDRANRGAATAYVELHFTQRADNLTYLANCARNL